VPVTIVLPTQPIVSWQLVPQIAQWLPQDTPLLWVMLPLAQTLPHHAQEVFYQPKSYLLLVPPLPEQPLPTANITMLQEFVFNAEVIKQVSKTAQLAQETVLTAPCHQEPHHAQHATVDTIYGQPMEHV